MRPQKCWQCQLESGSAQTQLAGGGGGRWNDGLSQEQSNSRCYSNKLRGVHDASIKEEFPDELTTVVAVFFAKRSGSNEVIPTEISGHKELQLFLASENKEKKWYKRPSDKRVREMLPR